MLKEYTLKVTVQVGGEGEEDCDVRLARYMDTVNINVWEITHEEIVEKEVEHE